MNTVCGAGGTAGKVGMVDMENFQYFIAFNIMKGDKNLVLTGKAFANNLPSIERLFLSNRKKTDLLCSFSNQIANLPEYSE